MPYMKGLFVAVTGTSGQHSKIHKIVKSFGGTSISTSPETHPEIYSEVGGKIIFSNFAAARNVSFDMVNEDFDWITWADVDDILLNGEELLETADLALKTKMEGRDIDVVYFTYWYDVISDNKNNVLEVKIQHLRERLLRPGKFKWISRLHEVAVSNDDNWIPKSVTYPYDHQQKQTVAWVHLTSDKRTKQTLERNKVILDIQVAEEQGKDPRTLFYLARTHFDIGDDKALEEAEKLLLKYLEMSGWDAERANALEYLSLIYAKRGRHDKCVDILLQAIKEYPKHHILYLRLVSSYFQLGRDEFANHWLDVALNLPAPTVSSTISNDHEVRLMTASLCYMRARRKNDINDMEYWAKIRNNLLFGKDEGLLEFVTYNKNLTHAVTGIFNYSKWLKDNGYEKLLPDIIKNVPEELMDQPMIQILISNLLPPKKWSKKSIVYMAHFGGPHFEQWDARNVKTGIGGSETAVIRLGQEWAKLGYEVTVYCDCEKEQDFDGVKYIPYTRVNWNDEFNWLILWRSPHLVERVKTCKGLFMDLHDIASPLDWPAERFNKINKIFVKSNYHRENLPNIPDDKFAVIGNGISL